MANLPYRLNNPGSDRLIYQDGADLINIRVRPGEVVEVDLADSTQDAAFDQSKYTQTGTAQHKLKPSA